MVLEDTFSDVAFERGSPWENGYCESFHGKLRDECLSEARLIACRREGQFVYSLAVPETNATYARALSKSARGTMAGRRH